MLTGFSVSQHLVRDQELEEKVLVSDMVVSWDRVTRKCEKYAIIQAVYETKLVNLKDYYTKLLQKGGITRPASIQCVRALK